MNPIELVSSDIKLHVSKSNSLFKFDELEDVAQEHMQEFGPVMLRKYCNHVSKEEDRYLSMSEADINGVQLTGGITTESSSSAHSNGQSENSKETVTDSE